MPKARPQDREADRAAVAELALGVLDRGWVRATLLAELIGVSVQQLHAALVIPSSRGVIDKRTDEIRVGAKHGRLPRVLYRRGQQQPEPLPAWLDPEIVPPQGVCRLIAVFGEE